MIAPFHHPLSRRRFVQGVGATGLLLAAGLRKGDAASEGNRPTLTGPQLSLEIAALPVNYTGRPSIATAINGTLPGPLLRLRQGDEVTIRVRNRLAVTSSIHWHGIILPADMDGVPGLSFDGISPASEFTYRFKLNQYGTYWYHAHSRFQEQTGVYGPLVIDRAGGERYATDREHVVMLTDWTDQDPEHLYATLKRQSDYFNFGKRTVGDLIDDARRQGLQAALAERRMWAQMRMNPTDLADVGGAAYTYLMNGIAPAGNWTGLFKPGERVRLRFINGSAMSIFDIRIPGLSMTVIAADGQDVEPVTVDEFRLATAETLDVIVQPKSDAAYTIFAQSMDRAGYARGTLSSRPGLEADVPALDPRPLLTMADMAMAHGAATAAMSGNDGSTEAMDHSAMGHDMSGMDHAATGHGMSGMAQQGLTHPGPEKGPLVDSLAANPGYRLDDPGVGLRDNGRRVLTYADLRTLGGPIDPREAGREIELHLTGHMERFVWSFGGRKFSEAEPLRFDHGERLRITLVNDSMMTHPIHLHGMWSELTREDGEFQVRKHTVMVQPGQKLSYLVTADALGRWAYHCHLLYHMEAGMFREVVVAHAGDHTGHHS